jgi:hypothetical protein
MNNRRSIHAVEVRLVGLVDLHAARFIEVVSTLDQNRALV